MARSIEITKASAKYAAEEVLAGVQAGVEDISPDPMSKQVCGAWVADDKAVERQFAALRDPGHPRTSRKKSTALPANQAVNSAATSLLC